MCRQESGALGRNQNQLHIEDVSNATSNGLHAGTVLRWPASREFLGLPRKTLLNLARRSSVPAHPIGGGMRQTSRFPHAGEVLTLMSNLDDPQKQSATQKQFEPLLDPKQAAALLRVYQKTLVRLAREG